MEESKKMNDNPEIPGEQQENEPWQPYYQAMS
jgi:hypothetical protein